MGCVLSDSMGTKSKRSDTKPLWHAEDQAVRLAELTSEAPKIKEAPLRRDVRSLGRLLGETIKEQAGEALFATVESIRQLAIEYRETALDASQDQVSKRQHQLMQKVALIVADLDLVDAYRMAKA